MLGTVQSPQCMLLFSPGKLPSEPTQRLEQEQAQRVALEQVSGWDSAWLAIAQAMLSFPPAEPPCSCAVKRGLRLHWGSPAGCCCILAFGESREVLIPVLLNQIWRQEEVTATASLQVQLETRGDCFLEEKKPFVLHLSH